MFCFSKFRFSSHFFLQQGTPPSSNPIQHGNGQKIHNSLGCRSTPPVRNLQGSKGVQIGSPISLSAKKFGGSFGSTLPHLVTVEVLQQYVPMDQTFTNFYSGGGGVPTQMILYIVVTGLHHGFGVGYPSWFGRIATKKNITELFCFYRQ